MKQLASAVVALLLAAAAAGAAIPDPVRTESGLLSGVPGTSADVRVFKGIPFAAPPVGLLRWRPPQPASRWEGVRKADAFGPRCMQGGGGAQQQPISEDCLYLNVWTAAAAAGDRRPVIVWSYGGAFTGGAGSLPQYDGEALARKGVVFVTYNYRLGPFGFFSHPELTKESGRNASGNYGLMDLIAALQWVQKNIAAFGGDPGNVTIMGESAGGALVHAAVASPQGKGLFRRAISQSAPVRIERMLTLAQAETAGREAAAKAGAASLAELRARPAAEIQKGVAGGRPMVDGWYLPADASVMIAEGRHNNVDVLLGSNKDEGTFAFFGLANTTAQQFTEQARQRFVASADSFLKLYPTGSDEQTRTSILAAFRDEVAWNMRRWAAQAATGKRRAYLYYFTHAPPAAAGQPNRGASHTAEIPYAFNIPGPLWTDVDRRLADTMSSYWVNFARKGDPNGPGLPEWPEFEPRRTERLQVLGPTVTTGPALDPARVALFDMVAVPRVTRLDGTDIHWTEQGTGSKAVIFVHGWTCDDSSWSGQVPVISRDYRVITLDLPGHGRSGMPAGKFSMELFARAVDAVRAAAGINEAVLVGNSMGTPVIRKYALMYPNRVAGLVLVDGLVQIAEPGAAATPLLTVSAPAREKMVRGMFSKVTAPAIQQHILKMMLGAPEPTAAGAMEATMDRSQWNNTPVKAPTLAVYAGVRPLATADNVKRLYPNSEYHQIPDTGHFLMMEKPEEFNRLLTAFLVRVR